MDKYTYQLWGKLSNVGGLTPDEWFNQHPRFKTDDVILVKMNGVITEVTSVESCRVMLDMNEASSIEIAERYIYNYNNGLNQESEQIQKWKEQEIELAQAKLLLMKEGLL